MEVQYIPDEEKLFLASLFGGGTAGFFVDMALFPLDTLKTRLQSPQGFKKAGGFRGIYKGVGPQAIGSSPQAASFFLTYEALKFYIEPYTSKSLAPCMYMASAGVAEIVACMVRVPVEIVKQRRQTSHHPSHKIFRAALNEGIRDFNRQRKNGRSILSLLLDGQHHFSGLYRGFGTTVLRDMPFSVIQFPILEYISEEYRRRFKNGIPLESWEYAAAGSIAGGSSAALTTPLDVVKTRIMLADKKVIPATDLGPWNMMKRIYNAEGIKGLYSGFAPRVIWITVGGYIFFGSYDFSKHFFVKHILG
ncbi:S-adenosylmethionine mitochondrial carrier protein [Aethina tumida]|uniref:S-adenosylmethionine mitochondrial carrier protein n=1 Tax=Aethina tumida TaxID=116153 RepID=UPI00096AE503|nr:S-adenosylmethionine mitochondrial carrier protein [Aethina tumida]